MEERGEDVWKGRGKRAWEVGERGEVREMRDMYRRRGKGQGAQQ